MPGNKGQIIFKLDAQAYHDLLEFTEREGFASANIAARALVMAGMSAYPGWGVVRSEIVAVTHEVRTWLYNELTGSLRDLQAKLDMSLKIPPEKYTRGVRMKEESDTLHE